MKLLLLSYSFALCLLTFNLLGVGCASKEVVIHLDAKDEFRFAKENFDKKKYGRAAEGFKRLIFNHPGSEYVEEAQYLLGKSYFLKRAYPEAAQEYEFLLKSFPESRFADDAHFELALIYYKQSPKSYRDQSITKNALNYFEDFLTQYPESDRVEEAKEYRTKCIDKLVKKEFATAKLYMKLGHRKSAIIYLEDILKKYPSNSYLEEINRLLEICKGRASSASPE
jgi:outer membrane protein assembly factor BamD